MFQFFRGKRENTLGSPVKGKAVALSEVPDPTFGEEILGKGVAIIPEDGKICAPADGVIEMVFDTLHAVSMTTDTGAEVLIHIGLDTVTLKGAPFQAYVKVQQHVKRGQLLITADFDQIRKAGLDVITPVIICNTGDYKSVEAVTGREVKVGDTVLRLS